MEIRKALGIAGAILLFVGAFLPVVSVPILGSINYLSNGRGDGAIVVVISVVTVALALTDCFWGLWLTGGAASALLVFTLFNILIPLWHAERTMREDLQGNPFAGLADLGLNSIQLQWGWAVLVVGAAFVIAAAALAENWGVDERISKGRGIGLVLVCVGIGGLLAVLFPSLGKAYGTGNAYGLDSSTTGLEKLGANGRSRETEQYMNKLELLNVQGDYSNGRLKCLDRKCPSVWGKIRNNGSQTVDKVEITAYFPDSQGRTVFESKYMPVLASGESFGSDNTPLRPGYIKEFGYVVEECPSECVPSNVKVKITDIRLSGDSSIP